MRYSLCVLAGLLVFSLARAPLQVNHAQDVEAVSSITLHGAAPVRLDPHEAGDELSARHVMHIYESLFEYLPERPQTLSPCLAAEMPAWDAESLTYTIKLRDDVAFHDDACFEDGKGRAMVAQDVVFSLKRLAALPTSAGYWTLQGKIEGLDEFREKALQLCTEDEHGVYVTTDKWVEHLDTDVSGLQTPDDRTLKVKLTQTYPQLIDCLALPFGVVIPREAALGYDLNEHPVGTGPYTLVERSDEEWVYRRAPGYRKVVLKDLPENSPLKRFEGKQLPLTDELRYEFGRERQEQRELFMAGHYSVLDIYGEEIESFLEPESLKQGQPELQPAWHEAGMRLNISPTPTIDYIAFNMQDEQVGAEAGDKGRALRKAISRAFDRTDLVHQLSGGEGTPCHQMVPPWVRGFDPGNDLKNQHHDLKGARKLLRDAGFTVKQVGEEWKTLDGDQQVEVEVLLRSTTPAMKARANYLRKAVAEVGIKLKTELVSFMEFLRRQDESEGQGFDAGWVMDIPDPQNTLQMLYGPNKPPGINNACFDHERYNELYDEMARLADTDEEEAARKRELVAQLHRIIDEECPWVILNSRISFQVEWEQFTRPSPDYFATNHQKYWASR